MHHFILLPSLLLCIGIAVRYALTDAPNQLPWILFGISSFCSLVLAVMLRQHYALGNQNRIVRLEFRLRYFQLFQQPSTATESRLSFAQIAALRFADDGEFVTLLNRALHENLGANDIKKAISNWQADNMRV